MSLSEHREESSAGAVILRAGAPEDTRVLLIHDGHDNWGFPKGHLEGDENPADAARREVAEETGLEEITVLGKLGVLDWYFSDGDTRVHKFCHLFLCETDELETRPQLEEGITDCVWLEPTAARRRLTFDNTREYLDRALARYREIAGLAAGDG